MKKIIITSVFGAMGLGIIGSWVYHLGTEKTDDAVLEAHVVPISPKVAGYVKELLIKDNQPVKAGDILFIIDPVDYEIKVKQAEANWELARNNLQRMEAMNDKIRSVRQLDDAVAAEKAAEAILSAAKEDLTHTTIRSPQDGKVASRGIEQGAYVQAGQKQLSIVGNEYWVIANFKETQIKDMRAGQEVEIEIDAHPQETYKGKVDSIQAGTGARFSVFPPENATGNFVKIVQRVPVKIRFEKQPDPALAIGPGMSVVPKVYTR